MDFNRDHFALFELPVGFAIDSAALEQRYRDIQSKVHPDKHAHLSEAEKRVAMQWATQANEAFQTLKSPLKRAQYLLHLRGVDPEIERNTAMPMEFLMAQMEYRESVAEARSAGQMDVLDDLMSSLRKEIKQEYLTLGEQLDSTQDNAAAAQTVRRLLFKEKLLTEIDEAIEAIEAA